MPDDEATLPLDELMRAIEAEDRSAVRALAEEMHYADLAHAYQETLARHHITVAQILLTLGDTEERRRHLNARSTLNQLLKMGAVPVINENDTVATAEIRFGDNDRLAARVAAMISADTLVLLSDIDGLYTADPRKDKSATHIAEITESDFYLRLTSEAEVLRGLIGDPDINGA